MTLSVAVEGVTAAFVFAEGCRVVASPEELVHELQAVAADAIYGLDDKDRQDIKSSVRKMLRFGSYHPSGRGKPASEYLLRTATSGEVPLINNLVDINNLVSLKYLLPISLVDTRKAGTDDFLVRRGVEGETYVFNLSGQVLNLRDLLLLSKMPDDIPCATPVKDSQKTKVHEDTEGVIGVIYAPEVLSNMAGEAASLMAEMLEKWGGASRTDWSIETV